MVRGGMTLTYIEGLVSAIHILLEICPVKQSTKMSCKWAVPVLTAPEDISTRCSSHPQGKGEARC